MEYQPRTIALIAELQHAPVDGDPRSVQRVHARLFEEPTPPYMGFQVIPGGGVLSNPLPAGQALSQALFLPDRIQFREERTALDPESFGARMRQVLEVAAPERGIQALLQAQLTLRSLVNPRRWQDARELVRRGVMGLGDELEVLGRTPGIFGLRLSFPGENPETPPMDLRVESYRADPRSLFIEVRSVHGLITLPGNIRALEEHVQATYQFLIRRALPFVAHFDARAPH